MKAENTIMVVDDHEVNRVILSEIFKDKYIITEAVNGKDAIALLETMDKYPVVILLDIVMPVMDGFGVLDYLKEKELTEEIPVILITSYTASVDEQVEQEYRIADMVAKPFDVREVNRRVENIIRLYGRKRRERRRS